MKGRRHLKQSLKNLILFVALTAPLHAQAPATSFEELRAGLKLKENETIEVTDQNGDKYKAKMRGLSADTISITAKGVQRDLTESQVREIRHRRPDKWWNGMLIGLGAGVAAAAVGVATECQNDSECQFYAGL